ncbi:MAG: metal-dependent hydrolase [Mycobacterium sp.]
MTTSAVVSYPKTRRINFDFDQAGAVSKHYVKDDIVMSHALAFLSAVFPPGEDIFVRSVRRYREELTDPELKKRVAGFIGQEVTHGNHHRELNERLADMGYPVAYWDYILESTHRTEDLFDKLYPNPNRLRFFRHLLLSFTAAAEHFTAVLGEHVLTRPAIQDLVYDDEIRNLLNWHAFEELEHKSVAFDVYRTIGGSERMRINMMRLLSTIVMPALIAVSWLSIATTDPVGRRQPLRILRETISMVRGPAFKGFYKEMAPYKKHGFHPDQIDTTSVLTEWQERLFGNRGELSDHLR